MARVPKKKKWPKGLPKPGSAKYNAILARRRENAAREKEIEQARKMLGR